MPTIVLGTDEVDCFCAWVSAESGLPEHAEAGSDLKVKHSKFFCFSNISYSPILFIFLDKLW